MLQYLGSCSFLSALISNTVTSLSSSDPALKTMEMLRSNQISYSVMLSTLRKSFCFQNSMGERKTLWVSLAFVNQQLFKVCQKALSFYFLFQSATILKLKPQPSLLSVSPAISS